LIRCEKQEFPVCKWEIIRRTKHAADFAIILLLFSTVQSKHFHFKRVRNVRYTTSKQQHKGKSNVPFNTLKTAISKNERNGSCDKKLRLFWKKRTYIKSKVKFEVSPHVWPILSGILAEASQIPQGFSGLKKKHCYFKIQTHFVLFSFSICSNGH